LEREGLVEVTWLPFELHPQVPAEGIPRERYFGPGRSEQMRAHLQAAAAEVGLAMAAREVLINSRLALATAEFARERGAYPAVHRALFEAHWHLTGKLEDVEDLQRIAAGCGLDPEELGVALAEGRYEPVLDENRREAESIGVNAIPAHIFGGRYLVVGAHPYELFLQVVERLRTA
jgi:predicted DsbA family dithiol-disulfide isomerase